MVLGGVLLSVDTVKVTFANDFDFFKRRGFEDDEVAESLRVSVLPVTMSKNNLFGISDKKVVNAIEGNEDFGSRVRVTNIERKIFSTVVITVRERYPVYKLELGGGMTAVICGRLYVLDILNAADFEELEDTASWPLIAMPPEVGSGLDLDEDSIGTFITGAEAKSNYVEILEQLAPHFARLGRLSSFEDAICNIFRSISFEDGGSRGLFLVMRSRSSPTSLLRNDFALIIENADSPRLTDKLTKGWQAMHRFNNHIGRFNVEEREFFSDGTRVRDGIAVWITGWCTEHGGSCWICMGER